MLSSWEEPEKNDNRVRRRMPFRYLSVYTHGGRGEEGEEGGGGREKGRERKGKQRWWVRLREQ